MNFTQGRKSCFEVLIADAVFNVGYREPNSSLAQRTQDSGRETLKLSHQRGCNLQRSHTDRKEHQRSNNMSLKSLDFLSLTFVLKPVAGLSPPTENLEIMKHQPDVTIRSSKMTYGSVHKRRHESRILNLHSFCLGE